MTVSELRRLLFEVQRQEAEVGPAEVAELMAAWQGGDKHAVRVYGRDRRPGSCWHEWQLDCRETDYEGAGAMFLADEELDRDLHYICLRCGLTRKEKRRAE